MPNNSHDDQELTTLLLLDYPSHSALIANNTQAAYLENTTMTAKWDLNNDYLVVRVPGMVLIIDFIFLLTNALSSFF